MRHINFLSVFSIVFMLFISASVGANGACDSTTTTVVPGHCNRDGSVVGHYTLEDYWGTCDYIVNYRGDFGGDPYLDDGWIQNIIQCEDGSFYKYEFVHETHPRYQNNPEWAIWNTWEIVNYVESGVGNYVRPVWMEGVND